MTYSSPSVSPDAKISQDKMDKIIEAVIDGKYSYACLVMLEEAGYDPAHYIPYRTFNRLQKQHQAGYQSTQQTTAKVASLESKRGRAQPKSADLERNELETVQSERAELAAQKMAALQISDIDYVEAVSGQETASLRGGCGSYSTYQPTGQERCSGKMPFWQASLWLCRYST